MKAFSSFYDPILPELRGCTTTLLDFHLRQVARDFCDRTDCWVDTFPTIQMAESTLSYFVLTQEPKSQLVRLRRMTINGSLQWSALAPDPDDIVVPRFPPHKPPFTLDYNTDLLTLREQPAGDIVLVGSMKPTLAVTVLPDLLLNTHLEAMRTGVLSRLMRMGSKPWSNPELSEFYRTEYEAAINSAALIAARGHTRAPLRTTASRI